MKIAKWALLLSAVSLSACQGVGAKETPAATTTTPNTTTQSSTTNSATATPATSATGSTTATPATPQDEPALPVISDAEFQACIARFQERGKNEGLSNKTLEQVLAKVQYAPKVIELDRRQPEFTDTFANYLNRRVTDQRIERGRELYAKHRALLERISQEYGVPPQYLLAFWGLETNYGSFFGTTPVLDSLATLACDQRRSEFFTGELLGALRIVDKGDVEPARMIGSWAGAMGHTQFMPSVFLRYAIDADGDGRRDLWNSVPDALTSAANFLRGIGWEKGTRWGREVKLPENFPYQETGRNNARTLSEWSKLGVRTAQGGPLPQDDLKAALVVPAGHKGPAFLVYENFRVIMRWNRSEAYAIAVGHLADRIVGGGPLVQPPSSDAPRLTRAQVMELQTRLGEKGFSSGTPDGVLGPATRDAIRQYQHAQGLIADGFPDRELFKAIGVSLEEVQP